MPSHPARAILVVIGLLTAGATDLAGQTVTADEAPALLQPRKPPSRAELDRLEARKLYGLSLIQQRDDRIVEATRTLEEAVERDPESAILRRGLVPLYLALSRADDALASCRKALDLEPGDYETWYFYARQLKGLARAKEAASALKQAVDCVGVKDHPDLLVEMHFELGALNEELKQLDQAEAAFRAAAQILEKPEALQETGPFSREQIDAEAARTYERLGRVCIQSGHPDRAEIAFRQAQLKDPSRADRFNYNLAEVCLAQNKPGEALRCLDRYLLTQPPGAEAYELRISLLKKLNREQEILPSLEGFAERDGLNMALQLLLAQEYRHARQWAEAERRYLKLAAESPAPDVYRGLFALYKEQKRADKLLDVFDRAVADAAAAQKDRGGESAAVVKARGMLLVLRDDAELVKALLPEAVTDLKINRERSQETRRFLAVLAARTQQLDAAERLYNECLRRVRPENEAEVYGGLLEVLWEARKLPEIIRVCRLGLEQAQATNRVMFHVDLARALAQQDQGDEALDQAAEAVKLADDKNALRLRRFRVEILRQVGKYDEAIEECQSLLKDYTQSGEVRDIRYSLSNVYSAHKDHARAEEQLRRILEADPNHVTANNDLGYIMADQGKNLEEAEKLIRKAIALDLEDHKRTRVKPNDEPDQANAAYLDSLAWVLFRRGQLDEAQQWLEKAAKATEGHEDPVIWDHLGDVYFKQNQPAQAQNAWKKALDLYEVEKRRKADDHYEELKNKLKLLQP